jgi:CHASE2 domain-containing sensor protein
MRWRQPKVFISYRRDDAAVHAHSLHAELGKAFGERQVFFDVKVIDYGDAFARKISHGLDACDVLVAVIGPQWLTLAGADCRARIQSPDDYVRHEIASALRDGKLVIPVLVDGAKMPAKASLPADVAALADLNALAFSDREIGEDADRLVKKIRGPGETPRELFVRALSHRVGLAAALAMGCAAWLGLFDFLSLDTKTASATLWLADAVAPVAPSPELQVIAIDAATEKALGKPFRQNPAARRDHANLIRTLAQAGARTIAFDLFITKPSEADDAELVSAIAAAAALKAHVVFGANGFDGEQPAMVPALRAALPSWAALCYGERLGLASTVPLASQAASAPAGSAPGQARAVGLALAAAYPGTAKLAEGTRKVIVSGEAGIKEFGYSESERVGIGQDCQIGHTGDTVATALYRVVPRAALNAAERWLKYEAVGSMSAAALRQRFNGKTVLVGLTMPDDDVFPTFRGWAIEARHGLELHAAATSALLTGAVVQPLGLGAEFIAMVALGLFGARLARWQPGGRAWPGRMVVLATLAGCIAVALGLCLMQARLLNLTYPTAALLIGFWGTGRLNRGR